MTGARKTSEWLPKLRVAVQRRTSVAPDRGASLVEYMLLVVLIGVVALIAIQFAGDQNSELWSEVGSALG